MKSLVVVLGSLMIAQSFAGESLSNGDSAFSHQELYEEIDRYQHFLNEKQLINIHSYAYIKGDSEEKTINKQQFILFNANLQNRSDQAEMLEYDADLVFFRDIPSHKEGHCYYQMLKDRYAHFYVETSNANISLIASKYPLEDPMFTSFGERNQIFDFIIVGAEDALGHIYIASLQDENVLGTVIAKIEQDNANSKVLVPSILCSNLREIKHETFETAHHSNEYLAESISLFPPKGLIFGQYSLKELWRDKQRVLSSMQLEFTSAGNWMNSWENEQILCGGHAEVSASQDTEGNSTVGGSVSVTERSDSGTQYSAEVSGTLERDSDGNTSGKVEVKGSIDW